jgi:ureidoglycolate hydrolase
MPPFERFQVFKVRAGQAVLLDRGVWHGAPLAIDKPLNAIVLLLSRTGELDLSLVRFEENPVSIK